MESFAHIFGIGAMISLFIAYQQKKRKKLILSKLCADVCWVAHYFFLSAYAGMIPNAVGIFRELIFMQRGRFAWASSPVFLFLFIVLNWSFGALTFRSPVNVLPIAASTIVTLSLWCKKTKLTKIISIPVSLTFLIYDLFVGSWIGAVNESFAILSILISLSNILPNNKEKFNMKTIFTPDNPTTKDPVLISGEPIKNPAATITTDVTDLCKQKGSTFAKEIEEKFVSDFEKSEKLFQAGKVTERDLMAHVSTFVTVKDTLFVSYYANTKDPSENPENQTARLVYCPLNDLNHKTYFDIQSSGDKCGDKYVNMVYDTILMQKDDDTIYILWTARIEENYYRFYRTFTVSTKTLGEVQVNRFKVGNVVNDFSTSGIKTALTENGIGYKKMFSDIGIMQKLSSRIENGETYYYTGAYSGDFTCIIKSKDLITWEYVAQPDFPNSSLWENATYVLGDKCYYFVRQHDDTKFGFLTVYDLIKKTWEKPVLIGDSQSRADFIYYKENLYLFHAPINREHIGIVKINTDDISKSEPVLQAHMHTSCFYPFIQYFNGKGLAISYTIARKHIRLAKFDFDKYI